MYLFITLGLNKSMSSKKLGVMILNKIFTELNSILILMPLFFLTACKNDDGTSTIDDFETDNTENTGKDELPASITLIDIPEGTFTMGGATQPNDAPEVDVSLSAFQISEKEITNQQYLDFLNNAYLDGWIEVVLTDTGDPCGSYTESVAFGAGEAPNVGEAFIQFAETGGCTSDGHPEHEDNKSWIYFDNTTNTFELLDGSKSNWPANWIKWYGAYAFASYYGMNLPTEAQWEYAAKGGQQLQYPTDDGSISLEKANYNGDDPGFYNADGHSFAVGTYPPNPYGLYDMGGNVWEWCQDYYSESFYQEGVTDPVNTVEGPDSKRVRRGGSWNYHTTTLQTYARASDLPSRGNNHFGFRIVKN